jgi:ribonuclease kappa
LNSFVISAFAIVILGTLGFLFKNNHPELVGGEDDPEDGPAVAATVFTAVFIYAVRRKPIPIPNSRR